MPDISMDAKLDAMLVNLPNTENTHNWHAPLSDILPLNIISDFDKLITCPEALSYTLRISFNLPNSMSFALPKMIVSSIKKSFETIGAPLHTLTPCKTPYPHFFETKLITPQHIRGIGREIRDPLA